MEDYITIVSVNTNKTVVEDFIDLTESVEHKTTVWTVHPRKADHKNSKRKNK